MSISDPVNPAASSEPDVRDIDESVLQDLESKYSDVLCPVHGEPPHFDVAPDGSIVEHLCCAALLSIFRELQVQDGERPSPETGELQVQDGERPPPETE